MEEGKIDDIQSTIRLHTLDYNRLQTLSTSYPITTKMFSWQSNGKITCTSDFWTTEYGQAIRASVHQQTQQELYQQRLLKRIIQERNQMFRNMLSAAINIQCWWRKQQIFKATFFDYDGANSIWLGGETRRLKARETPSYIPTFPDLSYIQKTKAAKFLCGKMKSIESTENPLNIWAQSGPSPNVRYLSTLIDAGKYPDGSTVTGDMARRLSCACRSFNKRQGYHLVGSGSARVYYSDRVNRDEFYNKSPQNGHPLSIYFKYYPQWSYTGDDEGYSEGSYGEIKSFSESLNALSTQTVEYLPLQWKQNIHGTFQDNKVPLLRFYIKETFKRAHTRGFKRVQIDFSDDRDDILASLKEFCEKEVCNFNGVAARYGIEECNIRLMKLCWFTIAKKLSGMSVSEKSEYLEEITKNPYEMFHQELIIF